MFDRLKDDFCRIEKRIGIEQAIKLSPIYLLIGQNSLRNIKYRLDKFRLDLGENRGMMKLNTLITLSLYQDLESSQLGLFDESGNCQHSLGRCLSFVLTSYYIESGIVLINIPCINDALNEYTYFQQLVKDIKMFKNHFLFFIVTNDAEKLERLLSDESLFALSYNISNYTIDDYINLIATYTEANHISLSEEDKSMLRIMLAKYEGSLTQQILEIWARKILWDYYTSEKDNDCFLSPEQSEMLLVQIINRMQKQG